MIILVVALDLPEEQNPPILVADLAKVFSQKEKTLLEIKLDDFFMKTLNKIAVVTVSSLGDKDISDYAWQLLEERGKSGFLILIKPKDTYNKGEVFLAVGYGLERIIPDATAKQIVENEMIPRFKVNDLYGGIEKAIDVLIKFTKREYNFEQYAKTLTNKYTPLTTQNSNEQSQTKYFNNYEGNYKIPTTEYLEEGTLSFKVVGSELVGTCEQRVLPMGGLSKIKYVIKSINDQGEGNYLYSYQVYSRWGELLQKNNKAAEGRLKFSPDKILIDKDIFYKIGKYQDIPSDFYSYLESVNNCDSIFSIVLNSLSRISYEDLSSYLMKLYPSDTRIYKGYLFKVPDGYSSNLWLIPSDQSFEFNESVFGLSTFNPIIAYILTNTSLDDINSISPTTFIKSVKEDKMYLSENIINGLRLSAVYDGSENLAQLKMKDDFQIASERDNVIKQIVNFRERYLIANLKYIFTKFEIEGKCYLFKSDYDFDSQEIDMHLSINDNVYGTYIATIRAPLSLNEAQKFFANHSDFITTVKFKISSGINRKNLGIAGGGVPAKVMPNLYIIEEPFIQFRNGSGFLLNCKTNGLRGLLWPSTVNTVRWDLNNDIEKPNHSYESNIRIIKGFRIQ